MLESPEPSVLLREGQVRQTIFLYGGLEGLHQVMITLSFPDLGVDQSDVSKEPFTKRLRLEGEVEQIKVYKG